MAKRRYKVAGGDLVEKVKQLVSRSDVRRVCLMDEENSILEIPIAVGDPASPAAVLKAPILAAINAFGTLVKHCTIEVETADNPPGKDR
ncbi:MAG: DUF4342 domain-containing protein [Dehalococcoidales bacterium]|nr:DUF4342 domain-containing protein [Dehalococcoidales bacterium]